MRLPSRRRFLQTFGGGCALGVVGSVPNAAESHIRWRRSLGSHEHQLDGATRAHDGGVVVAGRTGSSNQDLTWLAAVNSAGSVQWEQTYDGPGFPAPAAVTRVGDGYVFAGTVGSAGHMAWVVRVDETGGERWRRTYGRIREPRSIVADETGIYLCGSASADWSNPSQQWVLALAHDGTPQWQRTYGEGDLMSIDKTDAGLVTAGTASSTRHIDGRTERVQNAALLGLDTSGDLTHRHTFGGVDTEAVAGMTPVPNGAVYAGHTSSPELPASQYQTGLLVRVDTRGRLIWRRTPDVEELVSVAMTPLGLAVIGILNGGPRWQRLLLFDRWGRERKRLKFGRGGWSSGLIPVGDNDIIVVGDGTHKPWAVRVDLGSPD